MSSVLIENEYSQTVVCIVRPHLPVNKKDHNLKRMWSFMAEKEGFEPSIPFWGIHDFQSCALGQLRDFSICFFASALADLLIIHYESENVKNYF